MTSVAVLVPVKGGNVKTRLSAVLSADQRRRFARLTLGDVLASLKSAGLISSTYVISPDGGVLEMAKRLGATAVKEPKDSGVNSAVLLGMRKVRSEVVMVVPSDLPLLRSSDISRLLELKEGLDIVIAPSVGFTGTNALVFSRSRPLALSYDDNSFWNHLRGAARASMTAGVCCRPGVMFDVDSTEDLRALARSSGGRASAAFARRSAR